MSEIAIELPMESIKRFCEKWQVVEFALFGSVLCDDSQPESDVDVMVEFYPHSHPTFQGLELMEAELEALFQREVDLITRQGIETSRNYLRRNAILSSAQVIYGTRHSVSA